MLLVEHVLIVFFSDQIRGAGRIERVVVVIAIDVCVE